MGIETIIGMIPKGGRYAKSVVNFVHKTVDDWPKFQSALKQITDLLKIGKLRLDGKQKTIFETNKNILKNHEKVTKEVEVPSSVTKKYPPFNVSKEDFTKGWTPTLVERSKARNIYKELEPPKEKYTAEMEAIDEELDALHFGDKYDHLSQAEKAKEFKNLQAKMKKLIDAAMKEDLTTLSLSEINKKTHAIQKRIREIANNPDIKGTVHKGPKRDMIEAISKSERKGLDDARTIIKRNKNLKKYGNTFPRLDPDNDMFIIFGLDSSGNPMKISRMTGRFGATKDWKTGDLTHKEGTSWWDTWDPKKNKMRKEGEEVWHNTTNDKGEVIMSNPDYNPMVLSKDQGIEGTMDIWRKLYDKEINISELSKKGFKLQDIDMLVKGRAAKKYLEKTKNPDHNIAMHEQTSTNEITDIMEDLYTRGDDVYKMSIEEWTKKIPEYFAHGGSVPGFATGGISNLFRERQGYRSGEAVIKLAKGARWLLRMLKEMSDDMIFGHGKFANMAEALKMKYFKQTEAAIKSLEAGGPIPDEILTNLRQDKRFQNLTVSKTGDKDFIEMQEVVVESKFPPESREFMGRPLKTEDFVKIDLMEFKKTLPSELIDKLNKLPVENQTVLLHQFKKAFDATKKGGVEGGIDILEKQLLEDFIPKGKPHAAGGLIDGYATGGVSNLFRQRQGFRTGNIAKLPEFLKFVERLLIKASNEIRQGLGKWKGLDIKQKIVQHDNLTKLATEFQKTKKFDKSFNEYFGIDAEKAFIEAQAKVKKPKVKDEFYSKKDMEKEWAFENKLAKQAMKQENQMIDKALSGMDERTLIKTKYPGISDDLLDKILVDANPQRKADVMSTMDQYLKLREIGKSEAEAYDIITRSFSKTPTKNATGGLIDGYATGGVSNLFRSR